MTTRSISRQSFLRTTAQAAAATYLAGLFRVLPEAQGILAQNPTTQDVELTALAASDPRVSTLRNSAYLKTAEFAGEINWDKAYLGHRNTPANLKGDALAVLFQNQSGSAEARFLVARLVGTQPQRPVVVTITPDELISSKGLSGVILVHDLAGKLLERLQVKDGHAVAPIAGKARGLAKPLQACQQPQTDNCVAFYYGACVPLIILDPLAYLACVAAGVGLCMYQYCS